MHNSIIRFTDFGEKFCLKVTDKKKIFLNAKQMELFLIPLFKTGQFKPWNVINLTASAKIAQLQKRIIPLNVK